MRLKSCKLYKHISAVLIVLFLICSALNIDYLFIIPFTLFLLYCRIDRANSIYLTSFEISLFLLCILEIILLFSSVYKLNSIKYLYSFITICLFVIFANRLISDKMKFYTITFTAIACIISLSCIPIFFIKYNLLISNGFVDFSQFRFLYKPFGIYSNDWVTILLSLLPFPVLRLFLYNKSNKQHNLWHLIFCLFTISIIVLNVLLCFSRAGFISVLIFFILIFVYIYKYIRLY